MRQLNISSWLHRVLRVRPTLTLFILDCFTEQLLFKKTSKRMSKNDTSLKKRSKKRQKRDATIFFRSKKYTRKTSDSTRSKNLMRRQPNSHPTIFLLNYPIHFGAIKPLAGEEVSPNGTHIILPCHATIIICH